MADLLHSGDISALRREAAERRSLAEAVRSRLPEAEAAHVVGAHLEQDGRLVVSMDSAAWAARVRFLASAIDGAELRVRVAPPDRARDRPSGG